MATDWSTFLDELREQILPLYQRHEGTFDTVQIHGRMHICRTILFAECMSRYYIAATPLQPGRGAIRYAIAFHDSGRQGNGPDYWESDSAGNCTEFLLRQGYSAVSGMTPAAVGLLITKGGSGHWGLEKRIVHDADVLDIMRPCCGHGGRAGFRESYLRFLGPRDDVNSQNLSVRAQLIEEAWRFIQASELCKYDLVGAADYMTDMLGILAKGQSDWPLLSEHLL